jgi:hypothetical protein
MLKAHGMATKDPHEVDISSECTEFQLHKSQHSILSGILNKVIDYTEHRLKKYIKHVKDPQQQAALKELLEKYKKGAVAIAWKAGRPVWIPITKDN